MMKVNRTEEQNKTSTYSILRTGNRKSRHGLIVTFYQHEDTFENDNHLMRIKCNRKHEIHFVTFTLTF